MNYQVIFNLGIIITFVIAMIFLIKFLSIKIEKNCKSKFLCEIILIIIFVIFNGGFGIIINNIWGYPGDTSTNKFEIFDHGKKLDILSKNSPGGFLNRVENSNVFFNIYNGVYALNPKKIHKIIEIDCALIDDGRVNLYEIYPVNYKYDDPEDWIEFLNKKHNLPYLHEITNPIQFVPIMTKCGLMLRMFNFILFVRDLNYNLNDDK